MKHLFFTLLLLIACSKQEPQFESSVKDVYYRYIFLTKLPLDSFQVNQKLDSLLTFYKVEENELERFKKVLDSDFQYREKIYSDFETQLDSNKMLNEFYIMYSDLTK